LICFVFKIQQHVTDYDYDTYGNATRLNSAKGTPDEVVEQYRYDLTGNLILEIDRLGSNYKFKKCYGE
jgi:YD repeat-containing protein